MSCMPSFKLGLFKSLTLILAFITVMSHLAYSASVPVDIHLRKSQFHTPHGRKSLDDCPSLCLTHTHTWNGPLRWKQASRWTKNKTVFGHIYSQALWKKWIYFLYSLLWSTSTTEISMELLKPEKLINENKVNTRREGRCRGNDAQ